MYEIIVERRLPIRKVVVASSQAVYGEGKYLRANGQPHYPGQRPAEQLAEHVWEILDPETGEPLRPAFTDEGGARPDNNSYAINKQTEELIALNLGRRYGIPSVGMRYSIVQGPRQSFRNAYSGALRIFAMQTVAGERPVIYEDGLQLRDYVYVGDVAAANLLVLEDERADYQAFNVGAGQTYGARLRPDHGGGRGTRQRWSPSSRANTALATPGTSFRRSTSSRRSAGSRAATPAELSRVHRLGQPPALFGNYSRAAREHMKKLGAVR